MTARQTAAQRDMALVTAALAGAPGEEHRGVQFWVVVARTICHRHGVHSLLGHHDDLPGHPDPPDVTPRQRQLLDLLAAGWTQDAIAAELGLTPLTVKSHLHLLYRRLRARNAPHAVALAIRAGII